MIVETKHAIGDIVYVKSDVRQLPRQITQITMFGGGNMYHCRVMAGIEQFDSAHFVFELTTDRDLKIAMGLEDKNEAEAAAA